MNPDIGTNFLQKFNFLIELLHEWRPLIEKIKAENDLRYRSGKLSGWLEEDIRYYFVWGGGGGEPKNEM